MRYQRLSDGVKGQSQPGYSGRMEDDQCASETTSCRTSSMAVEPVMRLSNLNCDRSSLSTSSTACTSHQPTAPFTPIPIPASFRPHPARLMTRSVSASHSRTFLTCTAACLTSVLTSLFFATRQKYSSTAPAPMPPVLLRCWLGGRKGIRPVKN